MGLYDSYVKKFAQAIVSATGNQPLIAGVAGKQIRVLSFMMQGQDVAVGTNNVKFVDSDGNQVSMMFYVDPKAGVTRAAPKDSHLIECPVGKGLSTNQSLAMGVSYQIEYVLWS